MTDHIPLGERRRHAIVSDRWDKRDLESILQEMKKFRSERALFGETVTSTGDELWADMFWSFLRARPELEPEDVMRPLFAINRKVMGEALGMSEYEECRSVGTVGDDVGAALATIAVADSVKSVWSRLKDLQDRAEELEHQLMQAEAAGDENGIAAVDAAMEELLAELDDRSPGIKAALAAGMKEAANQLGDEQQNGQSWGIEQGELQKMPAEERIALANKLNNPKLKEIAKLIGPLRTEALAIARESPFKGANELQTIHRSNDLARLLPSELMKLANPLTKKLFHKSWLESSLATYRVDSKPKLGRGGMVMCRDSSGSMGGAPDMWACALGGALLSIAKKDNRSFRGVVFSGPCQYKSFDFPAGDYPLDRTISWVTESYHGGTDFMTPLDVALQWLTEEYATTGKTTSDIVFVTDGLCQVRPDWQERFMAEMERIGSRLYGICIGGYALGEPLYSLAQGRIFQVSDFTSAGDIKEVIQRAS